MEARRATLSVIVTHTRSVTANLLANRIENMPTGVSLSGNHDGSSIAHDAPIVVSNTLVTDNRSTLGQSHLPMLKELVKLVDGTIRRVGLLPLKESEESEVRNVVPNVFKQTIHVQSKKRPVLEEHIAIPDFNIGIGKPFNQRLDRHQINKQSSIAGTESVENVIPTRIRLRSGIGLNLTVVFSDHNGQRIIGLGSAENIHIIVIECCVSFVPSVFISYWIDSWLSIVFLGRVG
jgi:hypothetical protein